MTPRAAAMNAATLAGSLRRGLLSTPLATSTPSGRAARDRGRDVLGRQTARQQERPPRARGDQRPGRRHAGAAVAVDVRVVEPERRRPAGLASNEASSRTRTTRISRANRAGRSRRRPRRREAARDPAPARRCGARPRRRARRRTRRPSARRPGSAARTSRAASGVDVALRPRPEVHADGVGARGRRHRRVLGRRDAADLDEEPSHRRSARAAPRSAAAGSGARISVSPTRIASTPAARSRATSAASRIPDSATTIRSAGIDGAQPDRQLAIDRERPQVAVVDADDLGAGRDRARDLVRVVRLDQRVQPARRARRPAASASVASSSAATISRIASAPAARASATW